MYTCNITGKQFDLEETDKHREGGLMFGYNCRFRAIVYILTKMLNVKTDIFMNVPINKKIKGIGMSDCSWSKVCEEKYDYVNTFSDKEPKLDICDAKDVLKFNKLNFIISSDIFNFLYPYSNLQIAFNNMYNMLKTGGFIIFTVPFVYGEHKEYYPNLHDWKIITRDSEKILINTTVDGKHEIYNNLNFNGEKLVMRLFTKTSLVKYLCDAGFIDIDFHMPDEDMNKYGIFWDNICSLVITARK